MHRGGPGRPLEPLVPRPPGDAGTLVVAAWWVNAMRTALSEDEFWKVVVEYDKYLREGGEFDRGIAEFRCWRRVRGTKRVARRRHS